MKPPYRIRTRRLELRAASLLAVEAEYAGQQELANFLQARVPSTWPPELTRDSIGWFMKELNAHPENRGWYLWYILEVKDDTKTLIGNCGFRGPRNSEGIVEIGFSILEEYRGSKYATEAVGALIKWAFLSPDVKAIHGETLPSMLASIRVMEKNRFVFFQTDPESSVATYELCRPSQSDLAPVIRTPV